MENVVNAPAPITLAGNALSGDATILTSAACPIGANVRILIGTELLLVTGGTGGTTWNVTRAIEGSTATAHSTGDAILFDLTAGALNQLLAETSGCGTLAARPLTALRTGARYKPTDSPYEYIYDGSVWVPFFCGIGCTEPVDGNYTWTNQGSASVSTANGGVVLACPAQSSDSLHVREIAAPATPYTITIGFLLNLFHSNFVAGGLVLRDNGGTPKLVTLAFAYDSGTSATFVVQETKWNSVSSFSAHYANIKWTPLGPMIFLRFTDNGTNRISYYSVDGVNWIQFFSVGRTDFITPTNVGFFMNQTNNIAGQSLWLLHWLQQ